jgi:hypothetical protein
VFAAYDVVVDYQMTSGTVDHWGIPVVLCYCRVWNYDCLVNQTKELTYLANASQSRKVSRQSYDNTNAVSNKTTPWWLKFGAWERVAHLQAALPQYDWVLYGDLDYIKDM